jgi:fatty acid desaturase
VRPGFVGIALCGGINAGHHSHARHLRRGPPLMERSGGKRQIVAGLCASAAFLIIFFGLGLVWWAALIAGAAVYGALVFLVLRRGVDTE